MLKNSGNTQLKKALKERFVFEYSAKIESKNTFLNFKEGRVTIESFNQELAELKAKVKISEELIRKYGEGFYTVSIKPIKPKK